MTRLLDRMTGLLAQLPGIGRKTALRIGLYILKMKAEEVRMLSDSLIEARERLRLCSVCSNLTEGERCDVCSDDARDHRLICVVEGPGDVMALERSRGYRGVYHVLGGALSPLDNVGPGDIRIRELLARVEAEAVVEVVLATNPTTEGEATAAYIARVLPRRDGLRVTRIARGLPVGSDLDLADEVTLYRALEGRSPVDRS